MKHAKLASRQERLRQAAARRAKLLAALDRSGLSAAAFARQHEINYTTFCGWHQRRDQNPSLPAFVEVALPVPAAPVERLIELGPVARLRLPSTAQVALAAQQQLARTRKTARPRL